MASGPLKRQLDDLTECSICTNDYNDPRSLPCLHTFCRSCLEMYCESKLPGDVSSCPLCKARFKIPGNGVVSLPANFVIGKVMAMKDTSCCHSQNSEASCEVCSTDGTNRPTSERKNASFFCVDCQKKLCDACNECHTKFKATSVHRRFKLDAGTTTSDDLATAVCEKHAGSKVELYCSECKMALCMVCFIESHKSHKCLDVTETVSPFCHQIMKDARSLKELSCKVEQDLADVLLWRDSFVSKVSTAKREILEQATRLKQSIDEDKDGVFGKLIALEQRSLKRIDSNVELRETTKSAIGILQKDFDEMLNKGTTCDVAQQVGILHDQSQQILKSQSRFLIQNNDVVDDFTYTPAPFTVSSSLIGKIKRVKTLAVKSTKPTLTHVIPGVAPVIGMTSLDGRLYVMRSHCIEIDVFDSSTFHFLRSLVLPCRSRAFGRVRAMTSCAFNNCVYVSDGAVTGVGENHVYRVQSDGNVTTSWPVDNGPSGLSVNSSRHVLVTCRWSKQIQEYTTDGVLVKEIPLIMLTDRCSRPWHAIPFSHQINDYYVVSHSGTVDGISKVNSQGRVICTYRSKSPAKQMHLRHIAVLSSGSILAADMGNDRIYMLNSTLESLCDVWLPVAGGIKEPFALHMDESRGRLYVGQHKKGQVLVFDNDQIVG